jgi:hypothetical protein
MFLFFWDDAVDREIGSYLPELALNIEKGSEYRRKSLEFARYHLGLSNPSVEPVAPTPGAAIFAGAGQILRENGNEDVCRRFYDQLVFFMDSCEIEQADRLAGKFPSIQEFWDARWGTTAVFTFCAFATSDSTIVQYL